MGRDLTLQHRAALYREACAIIADGHGRDITLDAVARRIATSRRQLQRAFKEVGDTSFREHLLAVRLDHAAELLLDGASVGQVAHDLGYGHATHFSRAFRQRHGVSPSEYARGARPAGDGRPQHLHDEG